MLYYIIFTLFTGCFTYELAQSMDTRYQEIEPRRENVSQPTRIRIALQEKKPVQQKINCWSHSKYDVAFGYTGVALDFNHLNLIELGDVSFLPPGGRALSHIVVSTYEQQKRQKRSLLSNDQFVERLCAGTARTALLHKNAPSCRHGFFFTTCLVNGVTYLVINIALDDATSTWGPRLRRQAIHKIIPFEDSARLCNPIFDPVDFPSVLQQKWPRLGTWWVNELGKTYFSFSHHHTHKDNFCSKNKFSLQCHEHDSVTIHAYNFLMNTLVIDKDSTDKIELCDEYEESIATKDKRKECATSLETIVQLCSGNRWYCSTKFGPFLFQKKSKSSNLEISYGEKIVQTCNLTTKSGLARLLAFLNNPHKILNAPQIVRRSKSFS